MAFARQTSFTGKHATETIEGFQRVLALKSLLPNDPVCSLALLGLARAYALANDKNHSRAACENFFALRRNADANLPVLKQAKSEYAKLSN